MSRLLRMGAALGVLALAVSIAGFLVWTKPQPAHKASADRVITVRAVRVQPVPIARVWEGYGTARAMHAADISAQVAARVIERPEGIEPGLRVAAGDVLVRLDPIDFEQRIAASTQVIASWEAQVAGLDVDERRLVDQFELGQEELRFDERELERVRSAAERSGANDVEVDRRQSLVTRKRRELSALQQQIESIVPERTRMQAMIGGERAALRMAQENLDRATIRAPIDGFLQEVRADRGEMLAVGAPVARIVDLSRLEIPLRLPVSASASIAVGDSVDLWADSPGGGAGDGTPARWTGRVIRIAPEADPGSRTVTVFAEVDQDVSEATPSRGRLLLPGQFLVARVTAAVAEPRAIVPRGAVTGDRVMLADERVQGGPRARSAPVRVLFHVSARFPTLDPDETEWAVLETGLVTGDTVITTNLDDVHEGTPVRVELRGAVAADGTPPAAARGGGSGGAGDGGGP